MTIYSADVVRVELHPMLDSWTPHAVLDLCLVSYLFFPFSYCFLDLPIRDLSHLGLWQIDRY